jgi:hypothetical protein
MSENREIIATIGDTIRIGDFCFKISETDTYRDSVSLTNYNKKIAINFSNISLNFSKAKKALSWVDRLNKQRIKGE